MRDVLTRSTVVDASRDILDSNHRLSPTRPVFLRVLLGLQEKEGDAKGSQKVNETAKPKIPDYKRKNLKTVVQL